MDYNQRLEFYLGKDKDVKHLDMNMYSIYDLNTTGHFESLYDVPLKNLLIKTNNGKQRFSYFTGDIINQEEQNNWTLCKNRCDGNKNSVILRCFNFGRHWHNYYNKPKDIPFQKKKKKNIVFWRGTSTGSSKHHSAKEGDWHPRPATRFTMIKKWFNKTDDIDVGFNFIHRDWLKPKYQKYVKSSCDIKKFLEYKYILSIEGNDKDSGLNWKLNSNSVVFMARPRVTTWLMETTLIPNKHYILLKDDFSDLHEKLLWCNNNQDKCIKIVENANTFMKQFNNISNEEQLEIDVLNKYFDLKAKIDDSILQALLNQYTEPQPNNTVNSIMQALSKQPTKIQPNNKDNSILQVVSKQPTKIQPNNKLNSILQMLS